MGLAAATWQALALAVVCGLPLAFVGIFCRRDEDEEAGTRLTVSLVPPPVSRLCVCGYCEPSCRHPSTPAGPHGGGCQWDAVEVWGSMEVGAPVGHTWAPATS